MSAQLFSTLSVAERIQFVRTSQGTPPTPKNWLATILMLGRPRTCVPGLLTYFLGLGYVAAPFSAYTITQAILCFFGGFIANLQNTYTDIEEDCHNLPGRAYTLAKFGPHRLFYSIIFIQTLMLLAAATLDIYNFIFMFVALILVHQYSFPPLYAKRRPITGLIVFALVITYPFMVSLLADPAHSLAIALVYGNDVDTNLQRDARSFLAMGATITVWFMAKGMFKNVPDFYGDRSAGILTSATFFTTWYRAALAATIVTVASYASFGLLPLYQLAPALLVSALLFLPIVIWNCARLIKANDGGAGNLCLKTDMVISVLFISFVLLIIHPSPQSVVAILIGLVIIGVSDSLNLDSRRGQDASSNIILTERQQ